MNHTLRTPVPASDLGARFHDATKDAILVELLNSKPDYSANNLGLATATHKSMILDAKSVVLISGTNLGALGFASDEKANFNQNVTISSANTVTSGNSQSIAQSSTLLNHVSLGTSGTVNVPFALETKVTNKSPVAGMHAGPVGPAIV